MSSRFIEHDSLSVAWAQAIRLVCEMGTEVSPLVVSITGFEKDGVVRETPAIRSEVERLLDARGRQAVGTVASTIFPVSLWNPSAPRLQLFERYSKILPRITKMSVKNRRGTYFQRMTSGGPTSKENQLDHVLNHYSSRTGVRRSALQVSVFDPTKDHTGGAQLGFPCLQHVSFSPSGDAEVSVNAFYASQYMVERAYGNYLGLCNLGRFVAHELGRRLARVTCYTGIALLDGPKSGVTGTLKILEEM